MKIYNLHLPCELIQYSSNLVDKHRYWQHEQPLRSGMVRGNNQKVYPDVQSSFQYRQDHLLPTFIILDILIKVFIIRILIIYHYLFSFCLSFRFSVRNAYQIAVSNIAHRVASRTNLLVHFVATADAKIRWK